jgi:hypothetical protein
MGGAAQAVGGCSEPMATEGLVTSGAVEEVATVAAVTEFQKLYDGLSGAAPDAPDGSGVFSSSVVCGGGPRGALGEQYPPGMTSKQRRYEQQRRRRQRTEAESK